MSGRRFRIGTVNGTKVIYVRCGVGMNPNGTTSHNHIIPDYLVFGSFNVPEGNETSNSLGRAGFRYEKFLSESAEPNTDVETAWFNSTEKKWFEAATKLETSSSNGFPVIVIRGLSDLAGGESGDTNEITKYRDIAAHNTVKVVLEYIYYLCKGTNYC
ncbi:hypothetical protein Pint_05923 [Pistacia integerrima]|uniref:Uncharacterized protein n=1 Tax=Pistacia integerrima TaxID=434235 RepID=A0ACC0Z7K4_9ROSI|nr:hypothetical protein Pint_05923 [Pistacia integerrima]